MSAFVLDTSAILTVLNGEEGLETVVSLLGQARNDEVVIYLIKNSVRRTWEVRRPFILPNC